MVRVALSCVRVWGESLLANLPPSLLFRLHTHTHTHTHTLTHTHTHPFLISSLPLSLSLSLSLSLTHTHSPLSLTPSLTLLGFLFFSFLFHSTKQVKKSIATNCRKNKITTNMLRSHAISVSNKKFSSTSLHLLSLLLLISSALSHVIDSRARTSGSISSTVN